MYTVCRRNIYSKYVNSKVSYGMLSVRWKIRVFIDSVNRHLYVGEELRQKLGNFIKSIFIRFFTLYSLTLSRLRMYKKATHRANFVY